MQQNGQKIFTVLQEIDFVSMFKNNELIPNILGFWRVSNSLVGRVRHSRFKICTIFTCIQSNLLFKNYNLRNHYHLLLPVTTLSALNHQLYMNEKWWWIYNEKAFMLLLTLIKTKSHYWRIRSRTGKRFIRKKCEISEDNWKLFCQQFL